MKHFHPTTRWKFVWLCFKHILFKCLIYYGASNQSFDRPPACTPSLKFVLSSTPNSVKASNVEPTVPCTPIVHSSTSNSIDPSQPITPTVSASKTTTSTAGSKRRALFCKEEYEGSSTVVKTRLPDQLPFPDRFSIRIEEAISADKGTCTGTFCEETTRCWPSVILLCFEQTSTPGRLQKNDSCSLQ